MIYSRTIHNALNWLFHVPIILKNKIKHIFKTQKQSYKVIFIKKAT